MYHAEDGLQMEKIKYLVMDVDGTLTDGRIYTGNQGEIAKAFSVKDGSAILLVLPKFEITPIVMTARSSPIVENRCRELGIIEVHQGVSDKLVKLRELVDDRLDAVAYIGDDITDIPCMKAVEASGGLVLCPSDAISEIKALADYVSCYKGGDGAVRDCITHIGCISTRQGTAERVMSVIDAVLTGEYVNRQKALLEEGCTYSIQEYSTRREEECPIETHRNHIDVQYMIEGREEFVIYDAGFLTQAGTYNEETDTEYWLNGVEQSRLVLLPGSCVVVYNRNPHKGAIMHRHSEHIKKLVFKILV